MNTIRILWLAATAGMLAMSACAYELPADATAGQGATSGATDGAGTASAPAPTCIPGQTSFCACPGGSDGVQVCSTAGTYNQCDCSVAVGPAANAGGDPPADTPPTPDGVGGSAAPAPDDNWTAICTSGRFWVNESDDEEDEDEDDLEGSPHMTPGRDCISCHAGEDPDDAPRYSVAGTVYPTLHEEDDCYGVDGAIVRITDSNGQVVELATNAAGNFYRPRSAGTIAVPYTASVIYQGREMPMMGPQTDLNCATCHGVAGTQGAPGRVIRP